jgi:DNA modification methylase
MSVKILTGDCRDVLKTLPDASVDSIVTDPPYHLTTGKKGGTGQQSLNLNSPAGRARIGTGFMGMAWDGGDIAQDPAMWAECLRVLKPGGHLLAFSGTRTQHRMVCAIEDAGFEIRDQAGWMYGSGFPKNLDVSKTIDKGAGATREVVGKMVTNTGMQGGNFKNKSSQGEIDITVAATDEAKRWEGWGTALKPAWEPICVARKPLIGTVAANVLEHGTGALNIDGCRVHTDDVLQLGKTGLASEKFFTKGDAPAVEKHQNLLGRWPANLLHDGSPEVVALFPAEAGASAPVTVRNGDKFRSTYGAFAGNTDEAGSTFQGDSGSAARFFWCPKTSPSDRHDGLGHVPTQFQQGSTLRHAEALGKERKGNHHPTVKPTELMRYLCRLVTPPGGTVLDPFMGSGSTLKAAELEGFDAIGIELDPAYVTIAQSRISSDMPLFKDIET